MKKALIFILLSATLIAGCKQNKIVTYQDAENAFLKSLTPQDTMEVMTAADDFMTFLQEGNVNEALSRLNVLYTDNVLYKPSDEYLNNLRSRFERMPVIKYHLDHFAFSTAGVNDICYRYSISEPDENGSAPTIKLVLNPVKVGKNWYLTLKDGSQASMDKLDDGQINPMAPAPEPIRLNKEK